jgi:hypothetical protein
MAAASMMSFGVFDMAIGVSGIGDQGITAIIKSRFLPVAGLGLGLDPGLGRPSPSHQA